jgi:hypothetical protein
MYLVVSIKFSRQNNPLISTKEASWLQHPVYFTKALHLCVCVSSVKVTA